MKIIGALLIASAVPILLLAAFGLIGAVVAAIIAFIAVVLGIVILVAAS